jgi:hypothetical protein
MRILTRRRGHLVKGLKGLAALKPFADAINKSERQIQNWMAAGLPHLRVGKTPYIPIAEACAGSSAEAIPTCLPPPCN